MAKMTVSGREEENQCDTDKEENDCKINKPPTRNIVIKGRKIQKRTKKLHFDDSDESESDDDGTSNSNRAKRKTDHVDRKKDDPNRRFDFRSVFQNKLLSGKILTHWNDKSDVNMLNVTNTVISKIANTSYDVIFSPNNSNKNSKIADNWNCDFEDSNAANAGVDVRDSPPPLGNVPASDEPITVAHNPNSVAQERNSIDPSTVTNSPIVANDGELSGKAILDRTIGTPDIVSSFGSWFSDIRTATKLAASTTVSHAVQKLATNAQTMLVTAANEWNEVNTIPKSNVPENQVKLPECKNVASKENNEADNAWDDDWDEEPIQLEKQQAFTSEQNDQQQESSVANETNNQLSDDGWDEDWGNDKTSANVFQSLQPEHVATGTLQLSDLDENPVVESDLKNEFGMKPEIAVEVSDKGCNGWDDDGWGDDVDDQALFSSHNVQLTSMPETSNATRIELSSTIYDDKFQSPTILDVPSELQKDQCNLSGDTNNLVEAQLPNVETIETNCKADDDVQVDSSGWDEDWCNKETLSNVAIGSLQLPDSDENLAIEDDLQEEFDVKPEIADELMSLNVDQAPGQGCNGVEFTNLSSIAKEADNAWDDDWDEEPIQLEKQQAFTSEQNDQQQESSVANETNNQLNDDGWDEDWGNDKTSANVFQSLQPEHVAIGTLQLSDIDENPMVESDLKDEFGTNAELQEDQCNLSGDTNNQVEAQLPNVETIETNCKADDDVQVDSSGWDEDWCNKKTLSNVAIGSLQLPDSDENLAIEDDLQEEFDVKPEIADELMSLNVDQAPGQGCNGVEFTNFSSIAKEADNAWDDDWDEEPIQLEKQQAFTSEQNDQQQESSVANETNNQLNDDGWDEDWGNDKTSANVFQSLQPEHVATGTLQLSDLDENPVVESDLKNEFGMKPEIAVEVSDKGCNGWDDDGWGDDVDDQALLSSHNVQLISIPETSNATRIELSSTIYDDKFQSPTIPDVPSELQEDQCNLSGDTNNLVEAQLPNVETIETNCKADDDVQVDSSGWVEDWCNKETLSNVAIGSLQLPDSDENLAIEDDLQKEFDVKPEIADELMSLNVDQTPDKVCNGVKSTNFSSIAKEVHNKWNDGEWDQSWDNETIQLEKPQKLTLKNQQKKSSISKEVNNKWNDGWGDDWDDVPIQLEKPKTMSTEKNHRQQKSSFADATSSQWNVGWDDWDEKSVEQQKPQPLSSSNARSFGSDNFHVDNQSTMQSQRQSATQPLHPSTVHSSGSQSPSSWFTDIRSATRSAAVTTVTHAVSRWSFNPANILDAVVDNLSNVVGVPSAEEMAAVMRQQKQQKRIQ